MDTLTPEPEDIPAPIVACWLCDRPFELDPDAFVETFLSGDQPTEEEEARLAAMCGEEAGSFITEEDLATLNAQQLKELNLTPESRDRLLSGETVAMGERHICPACRETPDLSEP